MSVYLGVPNGEVDYYGPSRGWLHAEDCLDFPRVANYFKNREKIIRIRFPDDMEDTQLRECYELMMCAFNRGATKDFDDCEDDSHRDQTGRITYRKWPVPEEPVFLAYVKGSPEKTSEQAQLLRGMLPQGAQVGVAIGDGHNVSQVREFMEWADVNDFSPLVIGSKLHPNRHTVLPRLDYKKTGWYHLHDPFASPLDVGAMKFARGRLTCSWIVY